LFLFLLLALKSKQAPVANTGLYIKRQAHISEQIRRLAAC
jgi:hypothetical protein